MTGLDIPFPASEYEVLLKLKGFNLIYPSDHPLGQMIKINMMIRAVNFEDDDYSSLINKEADPQEISPIGGKLFEIQYIRECAVKDVASFEWQKNYGPDTLNKYLKMTPLQNEDGFVKVISLRYPDYSLQALNKRYQKIKKTD